MDRNYWSNYTAKYPNATEVEELGIWDTPYIDDRYIGATSRSIDYHLLVNPITAFKIPNFNLLQSVTPSQTIGPTINTGEIPPSLSPSQ